ncbi:hypothetical protein J6590_057669 [Homalodisca vitripennis]|nr:hypothetical protein J6590_057669 [Homalodisca vitripennis]
MFNPVSSPIFNSKCIKRNCTKPTLSALSRADPVRRIQWTGIVTLPGVTLFHE